MKVVYDARLDVLMLVFRSDVVIADSDEAGPGVILDLDDSGNVVGIEVLDASQRVTAPDLVEFRVDH